MPSIQPPRKAALRGAFFDKLNFIFRKAVEVVNEGVDMTVGGGNLALEEGPVVVRLRLRQVLVKVQHLLD